MAYTSDRSIKQLDTATTIASNDLIPFWDTAGSTTKRATVTQLDPIIFRDRKTTTSGNATTGTPDKQVLLLSLDSSSAFSAVERISIPALKALMAPTSLSGAVITAGTLPATAISGTLAATQLPAITTAMLPSIPASKLDTILDLSGKTLTLPSTVTIPPANNAVVTASIRDGAVTPAKMLNGGKELVSSWANVKCDILDGKAIDFAAADISCTRAQDKTARTIRVNTTVKGVQVGDWVTTCRSALPTTDQIKPNAQDVRTDFSQHAWSPKVFSTTPSANERGILYLNDFEAGTTEIKAVDIDKDKRYVIKTLGDTNWTTLGALDASIGEPFYALADGSGTGTALEIIRELPGIWRVTESNPGGYFDFEVKQFVPYATLAEVGKSFAIRAVRVTNSFGITKAGRLATGKYRAYFTTLRSSTNYIMLSNSVNIADALVSTGVSKREAGYVDFFSGTGGTKADADEVSIATLG